ncbi:MAG TPA: extracellular solute-binding protein [Deinococcales bacterium]|nr:extracellular solute-binding protein [Deinococcales bacterium]
MKKVLALVGMTLALAAATSVRAADPVTITFWHTYNSDSNENKTLTTQVIPAFEKANPGIKVNAQVIPYPDFRQKLLTSIAGDTAPDVARLDIIWSPEFAAMGALQQLDKMSGFATLKAGVFKGPLSTNFYKGGYYGLPLDTNTQVMLYNVDALKAAGIAQPPVTVTQLKADLTKLQKKQGDKVTGWGFVVPGPYNWNLLPWIWSNGGDIVSPDYTKASGYLNGPKTVAAIQMLYDWYKAGLIAPTLGGAGLGSWEGMGSGAYAMTQDGPWTYPALKAQYKDLNVAHALFPRGSAGSISVVGGENIAMFKGSKNKDAAWKFMQFMLSPTAQMMMATTGQIPVINAALKDPYIVNHPYYGLYLQQLKTAKARTPIPQYAKMEEIIQGAFADIFGGKQTVKAALDAAAVKVDDLLK